MKVTTKYPVIIDSKKVSDGDFYMNATGQKVYTKSPVYINGKKVASGDFYMSFDATGKPTTEAEWKMFQVWHNKSNLTPKLEEDGKATALTLDSWSKNGDKFVKDAKALGFVLAGVTSPLPEPTKEEKDKAAKQGFQWDKFKGWVQFAATTAQQAGITDAILAKYGLQPRQDAPIGSTTTLVVNTQEEEEKRKRRNRIILWSGIGVAVLVGVILILRTRGGNAQTEVATTNKK